MYRPYRINMKKILLILAALFWATSINAAQYIPDSSISPAFTRDAEIVPTGEANGVCISNTGTPTPAITLCSTMDLTGKTVYIKLPEVTVATRPANHALVIVTDGNSGTDCTTGGGSTRVLCAWNGSAWASIGGGAGGGTGDVTDVLQTSNEICVLNPGGPQPQVSLCATVAILGKILQLGRLDLAGDITPASLTANTNDWNPSGLSTASTIRFSTSAIWSITGLLGGADGRIITLYNVGSFAAIFPNASSSSASGGRFAFGSDIIVGPNQGLIIQYDSTVSSWRALSTIINPGASAYCADAGSSDAYACSLTPPITAYTTGSHYFFRANTANTGAATLALNGIASPVTIKKPVGGVTTDLVDNDIRAGQIVEVVHDGTNFQMVSQLGNAPGGLSGLATGCLAKAASSTTLNDSAVCEDADSVNASKKVEVGDVSTNSFILKGTGITGKVGIQAVTLRKRNVTFIIGAESGAALTNADDQPDVYENQLAAFHITSVKCRTDAGTSVINLQRNDGTPANILSSDLSCTTGGATSTSFVSGEDAIAVGQMIDFVMVTAGGTAKRVTVTVTVVIDSE
jgi:hypothetical protein